MKQFTITLLSLCRDVDKEFDITFFSIIYGERERSLFSCGNMGGKLYCDILFIRIIGQIVHSPF